MSRDAPKISEVLDEATNALSNLRRSGGTEWKDYVQAFDFLKQAKRPMWYLPLQFAGRLALVGIGVAATLLMQYINADSPASTDEWLLLIYVGAPSLVVLTITQSRAP